MWPGVVLDVNGDIIDWPGWIFVDGQWIEGEDGFEGLRPSAVIKDRATGKLKTEHYYLKSMHYGFSKTLFHLIN